MMNQDLGWLRWVALVATGVAGVAASYLLLLYAIQRSVLFPVPPLPAGGLSGPTPSDVEPVWLQLETERSEAWLLRPLARGRERSPLIVFAHGNGELIDYWASEFQVPRRWGLAVLLVEYPGYGRSQGRPSEESITAAMVAAYDWAASRPDIDPLRILSYGRSVGGGAACALARERPVAALVLESTFTSVRRMARRFGLPGFLVRDPFDNLAAIRRYVGPVLLIHGERDDMISPEHARVLQRAARSATLHLEPCGHNDCPRPWPVLDRFLVEHGIL